MTLAASADILDWLPVLKWFWAAGAIVGVGTNVWTYREAFRDTRWVKATSRNAAKRIQAQQSLRTEFVTLTVQCAFAFVRMWGLTWPLPVLAAFARNWAVDATILTAFQLLLSYNSLMNLHDRRRCIELLSEHP